MVCGVRHATDLRHRARAIGYRRFLEGVTTMAKKSKKSKKGKKGKK
jgi:hypothetical protein